MNDLTQNNRCEKCDVTLATNIHFCPLCGSFIRDKTESDSPSSYTVNKPISEKKRTVNNLNRIFIFLLLSIIVASAINFILDKKINLTDFWGVYAIVSLFVIKLTVLDKIEKRRFSWRDIISICIISALYVIFIDWYAGGFSGFSVSFVVPSMITIGSIVVTVFALINMNPLNALTTYLILIVCSLLVMAATIILHVTARPAIIYLPSIIALIVTLVSLLLVVLLRANDFRDLLHPKRKL